MTDDRVQGVLRDAAAFLNDYGLRKSAAAAAILKATRRVARVWRERGEVLDVIDADTDCSFLSDVLNELRIEVQRRAH